MAGRYFYLVILLQLTWMEVRVAMAEPAGVCTIPSVQDAVFENFPPSDFVPHGAPGFHLSRVAEEFFMTAGAPYSSTQYETHLVDLFHSGTLFDSNSSYGGSYG